MVPTNTTKRVAGAHGRDRGRHTTDGSGPTPNPVFEGVNKTFVKDPTSNKKAPASSRRSAPFGNQPFSIPSTARSRLPWLGGRAPSTRQVFHSLNNGRATTSKLQPSLSHPTSTQSSGSTTPVSPTTSFSRLDVANPSRTPNFLSPIQLSHIIQSGAKTTPHSIPAIQGRATPTRSRWDRRKSILVPNHARTLAKSPSKEEMADLHHDLDGAGQSRSTTSTTASDYLDRLLSLQKGVKDSDIPAPLSVPRVLTAPISMNPNPNLLSPSLNLEDAGNPKSISNAINQLEDLIEEAVKVADHAHHVGLSEEVLNILADATTAVRKASNVERRQDKALSEPFKISDSNHETSSETPESDAPVPIANGTTSRGQFTMVDRNGKPHRSQQAYVIKSAPPRKSDQYKTPSWDPKLYGKGRSASYYDYRPKTNTDKTPLPMPIGSSEDRPAQRRPSGRLANLPKVPIQPSPVQISPKEAVNHRSRGISTVRSPPRRASSAPSPWVPPRHNTGVVDIEEGQRIHLRPHRPRYEIQNFDDYYAEKVRHMSTWIPEQVHHLLDSSGKVSHTKHQPIARKWGIIRKRYTATVACFNTASVGFLIGIYSGMVPQIQYQLADLGHYAVLGNVYLYLGLALSTFVLWPLPLLHGRKPYILIALAVCLPLQFPQAIIVSAFRSPSTGTYRTGLLVSRFLTGFFLGFANINFFTVLLDLFGASLQSKAPHQEIVIPDDMRRDGGGMGIWLGIWSWCSIGSIAIGFVSGAGTINHYNPQWGFYITVIFLVIALFLNIITPETRRSAYRRSFKKYTVREDEKLSKTVGRGEIKLHMSTTPPDLWTQEVWAGLWLSCLMLFQRGFFMLALYLGWIYAQVVLVIILVGALLSREYRFTANYVGLGVFSVAVGALLAIPLSKAGLFSRSRTRPARTDSMTLESEVSWSSHLVRRVLFMLALPFAGVAYTVASPGGSVHYMVPILFAGLMGFLSNLAIAECLGLLMETYDTSDLQPGVNSTHRLQSVGTIVRRRRTTYTSYPRVSAGFFAAQTIGFLLAAAATGVGGVMTRRLGAQLSTGVTAAVLLAITLLLTAVLWRFKKVQVLPSGAFGTGGFALKQTPSGNRRGTVEIGDWKPVVVGTPSGTMRRMSVLEEGRLSRWTEIRRLNRLIGD